MARQLGRGYSKKWREGTLGIRGLPSVEMLGSAFDDYPVKGRRIVKIIEETNPSWDDVVKVVEDEND
jgi:hypothetical protein